MPREHIRTPDGPWNIQIGWGDHGVQLGLEHSTGISIITMLYGNDEALGAIGKNLAEKFLVKKSEVDSMNASEFRTLARDVLDVIESSQSSPGYPSYNSLWANLERPQINHLVRTLRRARDRAFGADE
jgi:hypothetical protein